MGLGMQIASLFASIGVDAKPFEKGLGGAKQSLEQFGGEMAKQVIGTVSLAAAVYKAGQAVVDSIVDWADYADGMRLSAQMAGVTTEEMSRLSQAADDFRVPMETMQRSMEMALKNGFAPTIDNIADLSDKLIGISDPAARAAAASKIFGKSYADMMPFLMAGGDAIRSATTNIDANLVVTEEAAKQAKKYKDELDNLGDTWTGLKNQLGKFLVPVATNIFSTLSDDLVEFAGHVSYLFTVMDYWGTKPFNLDNVAGFTNDMMAFFTSPLITEDPAKFMELLQIRIAEMNDEMGRTAGAATPASDGLANVGASAAASMAVLNAIDLSGAREEYLMTAATLREDLAGAYADVADAEDNWRSGVGGSIKTQLDTQFDGGVIGAEEYLTKLQLIDDQFGTGYVLKYKMELEVDDLFKTLMENPEEFANKASAFEDYFMPLDESVGAAMDRVAELQAELNKLERDYNVFVNITIRKTENGYSPEPEIDTGHLEVQEFPRAAGGPVADNSLYLVGEQGPELFVPEGNGQIIPNNEIVAGNEGLLNIIPTVPNEMTFETSSYLGGEKGPELFVPNEQVVSDKELGRSKGEMPMGSQSQPAQTPKRESVPFSSVSQDYKNVPSASIIQEYKGITVLPRASSGFKGADWPNFVGEQSPELFVPNMGEQSPELFVPNTNGQSSSNEEMSWNNADLLNDILLELQNQPARMKVAIKEAMALVGG